MVLRALGLFIAGTLAACAGAAAPGGNGDSGSCDGAVCNGGCDTESDCKDPTRPHCDVKQHICVACVSSNDCPSGQICNPTLGVCADGCSATHGCAPDGGVCEVDAGLCVGCLSNLDCTDPANPRCELTTHLCFPCLPIDDNCGFATYCAQSTQDPFFSCQPGCKNNGDCASADGGSDGDGGAAGGTLCDPNKHSCVQCLVDDDCALGQICQNGTCVDGCTTSHGCPGALSCCGTSCVDTTADFANCGGCGIGCQGGWNCCNSVCTNPANDTQNCGGCGKTCTVDNGTPTCFMRMCQIQGCSSGHADCNNTYKDGCETDTDTNVNNCGHCNNVCNLDHAQSKCVGGTCAVATCILPWGNCDGVDTNGCETNILAGDLGNCGACNTGCTLAHATPQCVTGVCQIASCDQGWADCNHDPKDGCEIDLSTTANCGGCGQVCAPANAAPQCVGGMCRVQSCNAGWADCDTLPGNGCEINVGIDTRNCGTCGLVCSTVNGVPSCVPGAGGPICRIACNTGFGNCDNDASNGCEVNLNTDKNNCSACGTACSLANATPACAQGVCVIGSCNVGWADCNNDPKDGCEINIAADPLHCGSCGKVCSTANGTPGCANNVCTITCNRGYANCNGDAGDGCEVNTNTTVSDCGSCGNVCVLPHATPTCQAGLCAVLACAQNYGDCDGVATNGCEINTATDISNCGSCGVACSSVNGTPACVGSTCQITCAQGFADCDHSALNGCEINTTNDVRNCNACSAACSLPHATAKCANSACAILNCDAGYADCDGNPVNGCEINLTNDVAHCGGCLTTCSSNNGTPACVNSNCFINCNTGFFDCDGNVGNGCEVNVNIDPVNCGGCRVACSTQNVVLATCSAGHCNGACVNGFVDCNNNKQIDGCEIGVFTDPANCGNCGTLCSTTNIATPTCTLGTCTGNCNFGFADCDGNKQTNGCEVNILASAANCGACSQPCSPNNISNPSCSSGKCNGVCNAGFADCNNDKLTDGCEIDILGSPNNCGGCGTICPAINIATPTCSNGMCNGQCNNGFADCNGNKLTDGCEINILSSPGNCGACNQPCSSQNITTPICSNGQCTGACDAGFADCDFSKLTNGCETNIASNVNACGACNQICSNNNITMPLCSAGKCTGACNNGYADCDNDKLGNGCETNIVTNIAACGACGQACSPNHISAPTCFAGQCNGVCDLGYADCNNNKQGDGCETNVFTNVNSCGACGMVCSNQNISSLSCANGVCNGPCVMGFGDCNNNKQQDGCETNIDSSVATCGACGRACSTSHVTAMCSGGTCNGPCDAGWADCNGNKQQDGCEVNIWAANNCGACGVQCSNQNIATPTCTMGTCDGNCNTGFADCDGNKQTNGCEISILTSPTNCGTCGTICSGNHITNPTCSGGMCNGQCDAGWADCDGNKQTNGCETNIATNTAACGACNQMCSNSHIAMPVCVAGVCTGACDNGYSDCDNDKLTNGCETSTATDPSNCGICRTICSGNNIGQTTCTNGVCSGACNAGWADCDTNKQTNGCETSIWSILNCGACGVLCSNSNIATPTCTSGTCDGACNNGFADCDNNKQGNGCETNIASNIAACGACGVTCSNNHIGAPTCAAGKCTGVCDAGWGDCNSNKQSDGCETNVWSISNCGTCGVVCSNQNIATPTCTAGTCDGACNTGFADCDGNKQGNGCEVNIYTIANCGGCGTPCSSSHVPVPVCTTGVCTGACATGWADCNNNKLSDGCETNVFATANCGACGVVCSSQNIAMPTCTSGTCDGACNPGFADCDTNKQTNGCETNTSGNTANCGGCNVNCSPNHISAPVCANSQCTGVCDQGWGDCNSNRQSDGCETSIWSVTNCGSCGVMCSNQNIAMPTCTTGTCDGACNNGFADCDTNKQSNGCETNIISNIAACGACGVACSNSHITTPTCANFACNGSCDLGWADCDANKQGNGCETNIFAIGNCGACGVVCSGQNIATPTCTMGSCDGACNNGFADCDNNKQSNGCETNISANIANCGGCNVNCSNNHITAPTCANFQCTGVCDAGWGDCNNNKQSDGCETNIFAIGNCGGCGVVCSNQNIATPTCTAGTCDGACNTGFADCDGNKQTNGCEVNIYTVANCGGCGTSCSNSHIPVPVCTTGTCTGACASGWADCNNNKQSDGCETNVFAIANCGACGVVCSGQNIATPTCTAGTCDGACNNGFADCDNNKQTNGCEQNISGNTANCGGCGVNCSNNHISAPVCTNGQCTGVCDAGWGDCNSNKQSDGCETNIFAIGNCGGCGVVCSNQNIATPTCTAGTCDGACNTGFADCDGNKQTNGCEVNIYSVANCGGCGTACSNSHVPVPVCTTGTCTGACASGWADCNNNKQSDGCETNVFAIANCGACGVVCSNQNIASPTCTAGTCDGACNNGFADCDNNKQTNGCEQNISGNTANCGGCGVNCSNNHISAPVCTNGQCTGVCDQGWADCNSNKQSDGCETSIWSAINCGSCGVICSGTNIATPTCTMGTCDGACNNGFADCDGNKQTNGCETNIISNTMACGGCGLGCSNSHITTPTCTNFACNGACDSGWGDCDNNKQTNGCEVNIFSITNCGGCGVVCSSTNITPSCTSGTCNGTCAMGWADCNANKQIDGCETNTATGVNNCGGCGVLCNNNHIAVPTCTGGACTGVCDNGWADCNSNKQSDGCETNVFAPSNCGTCGVVCSNQNITTPTCTMGTCDGACNNGFADCDGNKQTNGCEINIISNTMACGGCGLACSNSHITTPTCVNFACNGACDVGWADCDNNKQTNGCEVNIFAVNNCGACGVVCSSSNITPSCTSGTCNGVCAAGWTDCDNNKRTNGCEINTAADPNNCGACGTICSNSHIAAPTCANGQCNGTCDAGWADCDGNKQSNGCETNIASNTNACGACNAICSNSHITTTACANGQCTGACDTGWSDCNTNKLSDGCETDTGTGINNCGGCGVHCSTNHITTPSCLNGVCNGACDAGWADCDGNKQTNGCETNIWSITNCGTCGTQCSAANIAASCTMGTCDGVCNTGWMDCNNNKQSDGCETNTASGIGNCGGCGVVCSNAHITTPVCMSGTCNGACDAGWADCNGNKQTDGCETNTSANFANCGACNALCSNNNIPSPTCTNSVCNGVCAAGWADCDNNKLGNGCETNTSANIADCGGCNNSCSSINIATPTCTNSVCDGACNAGFADCNNNKLSDGCETNTSGNIFDCGACNAVCSSQNIAVRSCTAGVCDGMCNAGFADCNNNKLSDGCEINTNTNPNNCGGCNTMCSGQNLVMPVCSGGQCTGMCLMGFADCNMNKQTDGCEINIDSDPNNCGNCMVVCSNSNMFTRTCGGGQCNGICAGGFADCNNNKLSDGCEININTSVPNCGGCGKQCSNQHITTPTCAAGKCNGVCDVGWADCDNDKLNNGCETDTTANVNACGGCGQMCSPQHITTPTCAGSQCNGACDVGWADCNNNKLTDGCERNIGTNIMDCGGCGLACSPQHIVTLSCAAGVCNGACVSGFADCDNNKQTNGCETDIAGNVNTCGGCGLQCSPNHVPITACSGGQCTGACALGWSDCDNNKQTNGCEINTAADANNCGACGTVCSSSNMATRTCANNLCNGNCNSGWADCDSNKQTNGCEISTDTDPDHCGGCSTVCSNMNMATRTCAGGVCNGNCSSGWADCNSNKQSDGCETGISANLMNCGGCNLACSNNHITTPTCVNGVCNGICDSGWTDCDGNKQGNGCETNTAGDPNNCGSCNTQCSNQNIGTPTCSNGACTGTCNSGWADCNGNKQTDGCETNTSNSIIDCGGCNNHCSSINIATPSCLNGTCNGLCNNGFADCNNNKLSDGCETNIGTAAATCGGCNNNCSNAHITTPTCLNGICNGNCDAGWADCNSNKLSDGCEVNIWTASNCGGCNVQCSAQNMATVTCTSGTCDGNCGAGYADCNSNKQSDGCEVNILASINNCGGCNIQCSGSHVVSSACTSGACTGTCLAGWGNCNSNLQLDGCETDVSSNINNCGTCGTMCSGQNVVNSACTNSACSGTCAMGWGDCNGNLQLDGCEKNLTNTTANCGACNKVCSGQNVVNSACTNSVCTGTCAMGFGDCNNNLQTDGCESNTNTSTGNCGTCGTICSGQNVVGSACTNGVCTGTCATNFGDCNNNLQLDGCEASLQTNINTCGGCNKVCSAQHISVRSCAAGVCNGNCDGGWGDCNMDKLTDGCEANLNSTTSCGVCGNVCPSYANSIPTCNSGTCGIQCSAGWGSCDGNLLNGCETNVLNDVNHCGTCTTQCTAIPGTHSSPVCTNGSCSVQCDVDWADCDGVQSNGCESYLKTNANNCGVCFNKCTASGICWNYTCSVPVSFAAATTYPIPASSYGLTTADFNGDGAWDIAIDGQSTVGACTSPGFVAILPGTSPPNGTFAAANSSCGPFNGTPKGISAADMNNDNNPDLVFADYSNGNVVIYVGNGTNIPQNGNSVAYPMGSGGVVYALAGTAGVKTGTFSFNYNNDSYPDVATINQFPSPPNAFSVRPGTLGGGLGSNPTGITTSLGAGVAGVNHLAAGDLNKDGCIDIVTANTNSGNVSVMLDSAACNGAFSPSSQSPKKVGLAVGPAAVAIADVDFDGNLDLMVTNKGDAQVYLLRGNGDGTFGTSTGIATQNGPFGIVSADFNHDTLPDIAVANQSSNSVSVLLSVGNGTLQAASNYPLAAGAGPTWLVAHDYNNDNKPDIVVLCPGTNTISVLLNNSP